MIPKIIKANRIHGANIYLREIIESDAKFILDLRLDSVKNKYLSEISGRLEDQINWIREYKIDQNQAYFIACDKRGNKLGCVRMYDPIGSSYCWGSWLMISDLSPVISIESALLIYAYGKYLGFKEARMDVRKDNQFVWRFHEKFASAELVSETDLDRYYVVNSSSINSMLIKYSNLITVPLNVEY